jgi:hypothetical protein
VARSKVWHAYFNYQVSAGDKHGVNAMDQLDIETNIRKFIQGNGQNNGLQPAERYASFDYCFNYFQSFREEGLIDQLANPKHIQISCLQLCFYLASWGMLKGSSPLLQKSAKFYEPLIKYIAFAPRELWEIDALGVFGNVPAFDSAFNYRFGVSTFGRAALGKIQNFIQETRKLSQCTAYQRLILFMVNPRIGFTPG